MKSKTITYRGKSYKNIAELAEEYGVNANTLYRRLLKGYSVEDALKIRKTNMPITYKGVTYKKLEDLAKAYNIELSALRTRLHSGHSLEDSINWGHSRHSVCVFGNEHKNLLVLAKYYGVDYENLTTRISRGLSTEEAIKTLLQKEVLTYKGVEYKNLTDLGAKHNIEPRILTKRIYRGWSLEDAVTRPITPKTPKNIYSFRGVNYSTQRELAEAYGLTLNFLKLMSRDKGYDFMTVLNLVVTFLEQYKGNRPALLIGIPAIIYNGVWYTTLKDFCVEINIDYSIVLSYKKVKKIEGHLELFDSMRNATRVMYIDTHSGKFFNRVEITKKHGGSIETILSKGYATKITVPTYPQCTFNPTGYCATPFTDFKKYLEVYEKSVSKRKDN